MPRKRRRVTMNPNGPPVERTVLMLDSDLKTRARVKAAELRTSLKGLITTALEKYLGS